MSDRRHAQRSRRQAILVAAAIAVAAGCTSGPAPSPKPPDRLVVGTTETVNVLDPAVCYDSFCARMLLANTHEGLIGFAPGSTTPAPALAQSWTVSEDGLTYTFTLQPNVVFHDGTPLTADVVKRSLERVRALSSTDTAAFLLFDTANDPPRSGVVAIEAPAPDTVVVRLGRRDASFLSKLEFPASSVVAPGPYPSDAAASDGVVVGTGPYLLEEGGFRRGDSIRLVRNERYWGPRPKTRRVTIRLYRSSAELQRAVEDGDVDVAFRTFSPEQSRALGRRDGIRAMDAPGAAIRFIAFNVRREPYTNVAFRRAIAAAIDRQALVTRVLGETAEPLYSLVPAGYESHRDVFRSAAGRAAVDEALTQSGVPAGERVAIELWYTPTHYGETESAVAQSIKDSLEGTGRFTVTLRTAEWADYKSFLARGDFGAYLLGWFPDYLSADDYLEPFVGSAGAAAVGSNYSSGEVDALLAEARTSDDPTRRSAVFVQVQEKSAADVPHVPLWQSRQVAFVRDGVRGLTLDASQALRLASVQAASA